MGAQWRVIGASVAGTKHLRTGRSCEDAWNVVTCDDITLCSIADGAGSAARAADGARTAVAYARSSLGDTQHGLNEIAERALTFAARGLTTTAERAGACMSDFNTTLTVAAMRGNDIAVAQVGDGLAVLRRLGRFEVIAYPREEKRFVEETEFLTVDRAHDAVAVCHSVPDDSGPIELALSTDGLAPLLLDQWVPPVPHDPFFDSLFKAVHEDRATASEIERFLNSPDVCQRTDDDKTLVLATRQR